MKTEFKGNRNEIEGKIISGIYDVILLDGTKNFCYQPLYYRTFRYIQVKIEAYNEPLVIHDFYSKFTAYPLKENATFSSSDTTLKSIWNTSWRTARLSAIEHITGKAEIHLSSSKPAAPGMLESHYAPRKKMYVGDIDLLLEKHKKDNFGILSFSKKYNFKNNLVLSPTQNESEAAQNLFGFLRKLDESDCDIILSEFIPEKGLGKAVNDRLKRAGA